MPAGSAAGRSIAGIAVGADQSTADSQATARPSSTSGWLGPSTGWGARVAVATDSVSPR
jgi:hypothetical protein